MSADPRLDTGSLHHHRAGSLARDPWAVVLAPEDAGWSFVGLRVATLAAGDHVGYSTGLDEALVVPLSGSFIIHHDDRTLELAGRSSPMVARTDVAYLPPSSDVRIAAPRGGRVAIATARTLAAPCGRKDLIWASSITARVEARGSGSASRLVRELCMPSVMEAERLMVVEVVTPGGNWSSYPPHKHDDSSATETRLEEVYYYEITPGRGRPGIAYQRAYGTDARPIDVLAEVRTGDLITIPHGWHGPSMAAPGYDLYYLNVMAGPDDRTWRVRDDPAHAWVRESWPAQAVDPRLSRYVEGTLTRGG